MQSRFQSEHKLDTRTASAMSNVAANKPDEDREPLLYLSWLLTKTCKLEFFKGRAATSGDPDERMVTMDPHVQPTAGMGHRSETDIGYEEWNEATHMVFVLCPSGFVEDRSSVLSLQRILAKVGDKFNAESNVGDDTYTRIHMLIAVMKAWTGVYVGHQAEVDEEFNPEVHSERVCGVLGAIFRFEALIERHKEQRDEAAEKADEIDKAVAAAVEAVEAAAVEAAAAATTNRDDLQ